MSLLFWGAMDHFWGVNVHHATIISQPLTSLPEPTACICTISPKRTCTSKLPDKSIGDHVIPLPKGFSCFGWLPMTRHLVGIVIGCLHHVIWIVNYQRWLFRRFVIVRVAIGLHKCRWVVSAMSLKHSPTASGLSSGLLPCGHLPICLMMGYQHHNIKLIGYYQQLFR